MDEKTEEQRGLEKAEEILLEKIKEHRRACQNAADIFYKERNKAAVKKRKKRLIANKSRNFNRQKKKLTK